MPTRFGTWVHRVIGSTPTSTAADTCGSAPGVPGRSVEPAAPAHAPSDASACPGPRAPSGARATRSHACLEDAMAYVHEPDSALIYDMRDERGQRET